MAAPTIVREGAARLASGDGVFFNAKQELQRDVTTLALRVVAQRMAAGEPLRFLDALAGNGTRALRALLEAPRGAIVAVANDIGVSAVRNIAQSAALSGLEVCAAGGLLVESLSASAKSLQTFVRPGESAPSLAVVRSDAHALMSALPGTFDVVELDPCGSVGDLLDPAIRALRPGGFLLATATDMGTLSGRFGGENACSARYGATPLPSAQHQSVEIAIRIVLGAVERAARGAGRRVVPMIAFGFSDFYVRVIVQVLAKRDETAAARIIRAGLLRACSQCSAHTTAGLDGVWHATECEECGASADSLQVCGPLWLGGTSSP
eukprot:3560846-Prymnesium_polylepis.2